ncbi:MAG: FAD-dependent thymidylate synthase [Planctomycetes bacterium]|nr:FAD-dependent thymidylate synthase [Planctomycetota bacterium]
MADAGRPYSPQERRLLARHFSQVDPRPHADVFVVRNLPGEVAATLNGVYSRSPLSMRDNFLERLKKGLELAGKDFDATVDADADAGKDVLSELMADRSGQFLKTYAIDHGHNSLREGSVVHLAVERVSQLVTRFVQRERRCSFEESSTRYISFGAEDHWRDPDVVAQGGECLTAYDEILKITFGLYAELSDALLAFLRRTRPLSATEKEAPWLRALKAEAFDAARYLLTPAIQTKWGMVVDARTLSDVVTELMSHPLAEFRLVGERLRDEGRKELPTLLAHAGPNAFLRAQYDVLPGLAAELGGGSEHGPQRPRTELIAYDRRIDVRLLASLVYEHDDRPLASIERAVEGLVPAERIALLDRLLDQRGPRDALPFAFEGAAPFEFECFVDFGAYRDIGRHRKGMQQQQRLTTAHGYVVPPLIEQAGLEERYRATLDRVAALWPSIAARFPLQAGYVVPFAFLQRVRIAFDPRQVGYFVELRSGPEGHFAYRKVALDMQEHVERVAPVFAHYVRAQKGEAFLGRMQAEQTADERRLDRMRRAGDVRDVSSPSP